MIFKFGQGRGKKIKMILGMSYVHGPQLAATKWKKNILPDSDVTAIVFLAHGYAGKLQSLQQYVVYVVW